MRHLVLTTIFILTLATAVFGGATSERIAKISPLNWPLLMSTYIGGSGQEGSVQYTGLLDATTDVHGNVIIVTMTTSMDLPEVPGGYQCGSCAGTDLMIVKLSPDLTTLLAAVKLGGNGLDDFAKVTVAGDGRIYIAAQTTSSDFPTTPGAYSRTLRGTQDVVVSVFDSSLTTLVASTYFGGSGWELWPDIDVSPEGDVFIVGLVDGYGVPTTAGAFQRSYAGGSVDCFVARFSRNLDTLKASTMVGGRYEDRSSDIHVCSNGDIVFGVTTESDNYPTTPGAYNSSYHGAPAPGQYKHDCAVTRLNGNLTTLVASTFVGGTDFEGAYLLNIDRDDNVYIGGHSSSPEYPVTSGAFDPVHNGYNEYFITKLSGDLSQLLASTFLSPNPTTGGWPFGNHLFVDTTGLVYLAGNAWDTLFYTTPNAYDTTLNGAGENNCLMILTNDLSQVIYSTFIGGTGGQMDAATASVSGGVVTVAGITKSTDFPTTANALQPHYGGGASDVYVLQIDTESCCKKTTGNVNYTGIVDLGDLSALVSYLTGGGYSLPCPSEANINGLGIVDLADLSALVSYLTGGGYVLPSCS
jgi:hypothetical protein